MDERAVPLTLRLRVAVERWFVVAVAVALLAVAVGGVLTVQAQGETTRTELRETASWESAGAFDHRARVTEAVGPFELGTVLRNRTAYFLRASPQLQGTFRYTYDASDGGDLAVRTDLVLVTRSVSERENNETELWRTERTLASDTVDSLPPGETAAVAFSHNVTAAAARAARIDERLGGTPGERELYVAARLDLSGTRNGRSVDRTRTYRLPVSFTDGVYRVEDPGRVTDDDVRRERVSVPVETSALERIAGPALLILGLGGLFALVLARVMGDLSVSDRDRAYLRYRRQRREYDEWITVVDGGVPVENPVHTDSLQGLVDLAIDTDARVLADRAAGHLLVRAEGVSYVYDPPPHPDRAEEDTPADDHAAANGADPGSDAGGEDDSA